MSMARWQRFVGCDRRQCVWKTIESPRDFASRLFHNGAVLTFEHKLTADYSDFAGEMNKRTLEWEPIMPRVVAEWIRDRHAEDDEAAIDADPWREHATMVTLS